MAVLHRNKDLKGLNSFGVCAEASAVVEFSSPDDLREYLIANPAILEGRWNTLGGGNNIIFTRDYEGTLLHPVGNEIKITDDDGETVVVNAAAGTDWDEFVAWCVANGLWGVENLSGIPGTVGASPVQNIGAYGAEVRDTIVSVEMLATGTLVHVTLCGEHCEFGYRDSIFKHSLKNKAVITSVNFRLSRTPSPKLGYGALADEVEKLGGPSLDNIRRAVLNIRDEKLPDPKKVGNAGSFFKNPIVDSKTAEKIRARYPDMPSYPGNSDDTVKLPAGWLIEKAGWKGRTEGNAGVYPKQALIIINTGGATGSEIIAFSDRVRDDVESQFGIRLEPEPNIW